MSGLKLFFQVNNFSSKSALILIFLNVHKILCSLLFVSKLLYKNLYSTVWKLKFRTFLLDANTLPPKKKKLNKTKK